MHFAFAGLSLQTQELTALFLAVRLVCSFMMEHDIHTILDLATLVSTLWVIYMIRFKLKATYNEDLDNLPKYYMVSVTALTLLLICKWSTESYRFWVITEPVSSLFQRLISILHVFNAGGSVCTSCSGHLPAYLSFSF